MARAEMMTRIAAKRDAAKVRATTEPAGPTPWRTAYRLLCLAYGRAMMGTN